LRFVTHNHSPPTVAAEVVPRDVEDLGRLLPPACLHVTAGCCVQGQQDGDEAGDKHPPLRHTGGYALYRDSTRRCVLVGDADGPPLHIELPPGASDIVTVVPLLQVERRPTAPGVDGSSSDVDPSSGNNSHITLAVIGLVNMFNPGGAVLAVSSARPEDADATGLGGSSCGGSDSGSWVLEAGADAAPTAHAAVHVSLRGSGSLLLHASAPPSAVFLSNERLPDVVYDSNSSCLLLDIPDPPVGVDPDDDVPRDILICW
jgi:hypothetical protein